MRRLGWAFLLHAPVAQIGDGDDCERTASRPAGPERQSVGQHVPPDDYQRRVGDGLFRPCSRRMGNHSLGSDYASDFGSDSHAVVGPARCETCCFNTAFAPAISASFAQNLHLDADHRAAKVLGVA